MRLSWKCVGVLLLVIVHCCCSANSDIANGRLNQARREPKPLDLSPSLGKISATFKKLLNKGLDLTLLISTLNVILTECLSTTLNETIGGIIGLPITIPFEIEAKFENHVVNAQSLMTSENMTAYCNGADFKEIHDYLWVKDQQFKDVVKFVHRFGYPNLYDSIRQTYEFYNCSKELIETLPKGPEAMVAEASQRQGANVRNEILYEGRKGLFQDPPENKCIPTLLAELSNLTKTGVLELLAFGDALILGIVADAPTQFLIGKIQEPIKGPSFREFRLLIPVRRIFNRLHDIIVSDPVVSWILDLVETELGLDLKSLNIIDTILNILEALLWYNFDPVPPIELASNMNSAYDKYMTH